MRLRVSRKFLRITTLVVGILAALVAFYLFGVRVSTRDAACRPQILSPSVYSAEDYRRAARKWVATAAEIDARLTELLRHEDLTDPAQLYDLSQTATDLAERATALARDTVFRPVPVALSPVSSAAQSVAAAHLVAVQAAQGWIGEPSVENRAASLESLRQARALRQQFAASPWLADRCEEGE